MNKIFFFENILFLLWQSGSSRDTWVNRVSQHLDTSTERIRELRTGAAPKPTEISKASDAFETPEEDLLYNRLAGRQNLFQQNMIYLLDSLGHGGQKRIAEVVGVQAVTVTTWRKGRIPSTSTQEKIKEFFGLPYSLELEKDCLFLSLEPVGIFQKRAWIRDRISTMNDEELNDFFPALKRLLSGKDL